MSSLFFEGGHTQLCIHSGITLGGAWGLPGIEPGSAVCKTNALPIVLLLRSLIYLFLVFWGPYLAVFRNYSWNYLGDHVCCWVSCSGLLRARQASYSQYFFSSPSNIFWMNFKWISVLATWVGSSHRHFVQSVELVSFTNEIELFNWIFPWIVMSLICLFFFMLNF